VFLARKMHIIGIWIVLGVQCDSHRQPLRTISNLQKQTRVGIRRRHRMMLVRRDGPRQGQVVNPKPPKLLRSRSQTCWTKGDIFGNHVRNGPFRGTGASELRFDSPPFQPRITRRGTSHAADIDVLPEKPIRLSTPPERSVQPRSASSRAVPNRELDRGPPQVQRKEGDWPTLEERLVDF